MSAFTARHAKPLHGRGRIVRSAFVPHRLLANPHVQTLLPVLRRPPSSAAWRVEAMETADRDVVRLGWMDPAIAAERERIAVLVHGLAGGLRSVYAVSMARRLACDGWRVALIELRGAGDEPNRSARSYHHGDTADLRLLCQRLRARHPRAGIALIGWSLGACIVLKALAEEGEATPIDVAVAVGASFDLRASAESLRRRGGLYQFLMMRTLKSRLERKHRHVALPPRADLAAALAARDFFELGDAYTAPCNGYRDAQDYCDRAGCRSGLGRIARPTLVIQALDDPVLGRVELPGSDELAPGMTLEVSDHGGHAGFVSAGPFGAPCFWLETRVPEFLAGATK